MKPGGGPGVQIFGRRDSRDTQKALRFFKERRLPVSYVDVAARPPAPAELRRFSDRLGAAALLDSNGSLYRDRGMAYLRMDDEEVVSRVLEDPRLLRLPLVRLGSDVSVGLATGLWAGWLSRTEGSAERDRAR